MSSRLRRWATCMQKATALVWFDHTCNEQIATGGEWRAIRTVGCEKATNGWEPHWSNGTMKRLTNTLPPSVGDLFSYCWKYKQAMGYITYPRSTIQPTLIMENGNSTKICLIYQALTTAQEVSENCGGRGRVYELTDEHTWPSVLART